jgi:hypothetical protein
VPDDGGYLRLIEKYLGPIPLAANFPNNDLLARLKGISPADLQALVTTAKRMAMNAWRSTMKVYRRSLGMTSKRPFNGTKSTCRTARSWARGSRLLNPPVFT